VTFGLLNYAVLVGYLTVMVVIGLRFAGKQKTTEDYFLAGRRMPWLVVGMSMFASLTSAISYMGIPGTAYNENASFIVLGLSSILVSPILVVVFYPFYRHLNVTTSYEYVLRRYGKLAHYSVSGLFLLARLGWLGTVIYAPALALSVVTDIPLWLAILMMGVLATTYTVLGGLSAVLWTDLMQYLILVGGAIWVAVHLSGVVPGGVTGIVQLAREKGHLISWEFSWDQYLFQLTIFGVCLSTLCQLMHDYGTDQVTVQRLMSVKTYRGMVRAIVFNAMSDLVMIGLLSFVGLGLFAYYSTFPEKLAAGTSGDRVLPYFIMQALPNGVSGLLITAIFAAAMSSMDSGINSISTVVICDFIRPLRKRVTDESRDVLLARWWTLALGAFATLVAFFVAHIEHILKASATFISTFGGPILALFLLGMLTRRTNFYGWLLGTIVAVPATLWLNLATEVHFINYFPFAFGVCALVGYLASWLFVYAGKQHLADKNLTVGGFHQK